METKDFDKIVGENFLGFEFDSDAILKYAAYHEEMYGKELTVFQVKGFLPYAQVYHEYDDGSKEYLYYPVEEVVKHIEAKNMSDLEILKLRVVETKEIIKNIK
jgi:hypothetical protein